MSLDRKVDARPLCTEPLRLFADKFNAWGHFTTHVLKVPEGEPWSWAVLLPALQAALDARKRETLYATARQASAEAVPAELTDFWKDFLRLVVEGVEKGMKLKWYWTEQPNPGDGPHR